MKFDAALANTVWLASSLPERVRYRYAASRIEAVQRRILEGYVRRNADTEFGRRHGFADIVGWEEFADRVPLRNYDGFRDWIERIAAGEKNILTTEPVRLLEPSSGSSGAEKWVPYTRSLQAEFGRAVAVWITDLLLHNPSVLGGRAYWSLTPQVQRDRSQDTEVPIGFDEDSAYLGGFAQQLINRTLATAAGLSAVPDMDRFWLLTLSMLLCCRDLRMISVWHPSFALLLLAQMRERWPNILNAIASGVSDCDIVVSANPKRSRELARLGPDSVAAIWPRLTLISCWTDAHAAGCVPDIRAEFPGVRLQPKGLVATEAFISLPLDELRPLAIRSHFFEFRDSDDRVHPAWSLETGQTYAVIVTTGGGLYRYELQDRIEVTGHYREVPTLRFLGKEDNVSDYFGEKLNEAFVASQLETVLSRHGIVPAFAMIAMDRSGREPHYNLYIEAMAELPSNLDAELDAALCENPHYELCVRLGQLGRLRISRIAERAYEVYSRVLSARGQRLGDIKPTPLSRFSEWSQHFPKAD